MTKAKKTRAKKTTSAGESTEDAYRRIAVADMVGLSLSHIVSLLEHIDGLIDGGYLDALADEDIDDILKPLNTVRHLLGAALGEGPQVLVRY